MADFVNSLYLKKGKYGIKMSVKVDEFIRELQAKANAKGWANIEIKDKRTGDGHYAVWDDWNPEGATQPNNKPAPPAGGYKAKSDIPQNDASDSLPF